MSQGFIDINADLGEGAGFDADLIPHVSSANIACGAHAGDEATMRATVALALRHGVQIGAHPGFSDREHFGRREMLVSPRDAAVLVLGQVSSLRRIADEAGTRTAYVKLHGALYTMAARDQDLAAAISRAIWTVDRNLAVVTPAGSCLGLAVSAMGMRVVREVFADRTYQADGSLTSRMRADAFVSSEDEAVPRVVRMIREGRVTATDGTELAVSADTLCLHGDRPNAAAFARRIRAALVEAGIGIAPFVPLGRLPGS